MIRRLIVLTAVLSFGAVFAAPGAQASFGIANWEALTCSENLDTPANFGEQLIGFPPPQSPGQCTKALASESKWFKQAAGHPNFAITDFTLNTASAPKFKGFPEGFVKDIIVDTPQGLSVNPEATPQVHGGTAKSESAGMPGAISRRGQLPDGCRRGASMRTSLSVRRQLKPV